jgi:hypothetical protein
MRPSPSFQDMALRFRRSIRVARGIHLNSGLQSADTTTTPDRQDPDTGSVDWVDSVEFDRSSGCL